jgi:two-component system response regulator AtoC
VTKILVVDDEAEIRSLLGAVLQSKGFEVVAAEDGAAALQQVQRERPAVILLDLSMPRMSGMDALPEIKRLDGDVPVIICTAHADLATAVRAMKLGAYDFLTKPFDVELLVLTLQRAVERHQLLSRIEELKRQGQGSSLAERMGGSAAIGQVIQQVSQVAESNFTVLVQGETGTGKELVARAIHQQSPRQKAPFVAVDCGAIPETLVESELFGHERGAFTGAHQLKIGKFEAADRGTIFLDEIGDLHPALQGKLLHVLQDGQFSRVGGRSTVKVDVRVLAATNQDLEQAVAAGRFREDLYYRLNVIQIIVPPLRERPEEIAALAEYFMRRYSQLFRRESLHLPAETIQRLMHHRFPGNVRELENMIKRMIVLGDPLLRRSPLPGGPAPTEENGAPRPAKSATMSLKDIGRKAAQVAEREAILQALEQTQWNRVRAAKILEISYRALLYKIKDSGLDRERRGAHRL